MRPSVPLILLLIVVPLTLVAAANGEAIAVAGVAACIGLVAWHANRKKLAEKRTLVDRQSSEVEKLRQMMIDSARQKSRTK